ncbi:MAG: hypothetical protein F6K00_03065 [Leptolyngbya sp. SIOISBB]|nr:hypothetical protein [Leptolyngbya sp. SIOISBB]
MRAALLPLGLDISKTAVHVARLKRAHRSKYEPFTNDSEGFRPLSQCLATQGVQRVYACLEATSLDGHALALNRQS